MPLAFVENAARNDQRMCLSNYSISSAVLLHNTAGHCQCSIYIHCDVLLTTGFLRS